MAVQRLIRPTLVLAGGALVVALTAGCQGQFTANGSATDNSGSATVSAGSSPSAALGGSTEDSGPTSTASAGTGATAAGDPAAAQPPATALAPGQMASAILQVANTQMFPAQDCRPVSVRGLRVYAPDDTAAMFLANSPAATACSATAMPGGVQLSVRTITAGNGAQ
jgi:hypothetical protein